MLLSICCFLENLEEETTENNQNRGVEDPEAWHWLIYEVCVLEKMWKKILVLFSFSFFLFQLELFNDRKLMTSCTSGPAYF